MMPPLLSPRTLLTLPARACRYADITSRVEMIPTTAPSATTGAHSRCASAKVPRASSSASSPTIRWVAGGELREGGRARPEVVEHHRTEQPAVLVHHRCALESQRPSLASADAMSIDARRTSLGSGVS